MLLLAMRSFVPGRLLLPKLRGHVVIAIQRNLEPPTCLSASFFAPSYGLHQTMLETFSTAGLTFSFELAVVSRMLLRCGLINTLCQNHSIKSNSFTRPSPGSKEHDVLQEHMLLVWQTAFTARQSETVPTQQHGGRKVVR